MNFVVIGLGSMGKRRIRLLQEYLKNTDNESWAVFGVDNREDRRQEAEKLYGIRTSISLDIIIKENNVDAAFVCTSPLSHAAIITECLGRNLHVFTEINVIADEYDKNSALAEKKGSVLYLSSTFMHRKEMVYIKNWVQEKDHKLSYRYHVGQYLPEWHPWESYKSFFVNDKRTNACRELFAIELPWMTDAFGDVDGFVSKHNKLSELDIDYDDTYNVLICHSTGITGCLTVDVVSPKAERRLDVFGENSLLTWDGTPDSLKIMDHSDELEAVNLYDKTIHLNDYAKYIIEDAYYDEIEDFIRCIEQNTKPAYTFEKDAFVLKTIDGIEM